MEVKIRGGNGVSWEREKSGWIGEGGRKGVETSGIPAACSQESSVGLWMSIWVETAIYSAYAPVSDFLNSAFPRILSVPSQPSHIGVLEDFIVGEKTKGG